MKKETHGYIVMRSALIDPTTAATDVQADDLRPYDDNMAMGKFKNKLASLTLPDKEGLNTTHFTIVDSEGNMVTCTTTIESGWGKGVKKAPFITYTIESSTQRV